MAIGPRCLVDQCRVSFCLRPRATAEAQNCQREIAFIGPTFVDSSTRTSGAVYRSKSTTASVPFAHLLQLTAEHHLQAILLGLLPAHEVREFLHGELPASSRKPPDEVPEPFLPLGLMTWWHRRVAQVGTLFHAASFSAASLTALPMSTLAGTTLNLSSCTRSTRNFLSTASSSRSSASMFSAFTLRR